MRAVERIQCNSPLLMCRGLVQIPPYFYIFEVFDEDLIKVGIIATIKVVLCGCHREETDAEFRARIFKTLEGKKTREQLL